MALQTTAFVRQWLSIDHVGTLTDMNVTFALKQRKGVFCAIRAEMLLAGQLVMSRSVSGVE
jgi:hypothetical protein